MKKFMGRLAWILAIPFLISCATITVNVYFPDKDVEAALENVERGLDFDVVPTRKDTSAASPAAKPKTKSQSLDMFSASTAWAEGKTSINDELQKMDDVRDALDRRKDRIEMLKTLFESHLVGADKTGLIARLNVLDAKEAKEKIKAAFGTDDAKETDKTRDGRFAQFITDENKDRKILIHGLTVAMLRATEQDEKDKDVVAQALEKMVSQFAESQIKKLQPGWYYQNDEGKWTQVPAPEEKKEE